MPEGGVAIDGAVLVLEDDLIIGLDLTDMFEAMGAEVRSAASVAEALPLVEAGGLAIALLDVNLGPETSVDVARALADRGVPFLLATGYGDEDITAAYPPATVLRKPYSPKEVTAAVAALLG